MLKSFPYALQGLNFVVWTKENLSPIKLNGNMLCTTVWKFQNLQGFVQKTTELWLDGKS